MHCGEHFTFRSHLCIVFELMSIDLYEQIKLSRFKGFQLALVRRYALQILKCLQLIKEQKVRALICVLRESPSWFTHLYNSLTFSVSVCFYPRLFIVI